ncbi:hypothetical protein K503DRAFT_535471 [Rhizopogon vinicolor AM-OR11-026]|uniref:4a-hydroxytetrahydrobiopterin dehydratase n=1 Tax=Rhizopogon vinicolor AM-OR11-026 TaxID=1314800 RepID=A0A1B7N8D2_9AGAM|nr:hypothetical protein K503DRAFT_535471 [Rhizopogon vinicolor AM-OR11-026]
MLDLLKLPCRRVFSVARGSLHSRSYIQHLYCRSQPTGSADTCRQRHTTQCSSVRGYAINSPSDIKETQLEGLQGDDKKTSESTSSSAESLDTRSTSQSPKRSPRLELQDLPDLPPFPGKPTLHISPEDITTYLQPLISRQWSVGRVKKGLDERDVLSLNRHFDFKGFNDVMDFVHGVADISREEKHHARILIEYSTVVIFTHTHSAYTFHRLPDGKYESKKVPGLSRRDIRFAIKIEELHERFKAQGRALESVPTAHGGLQHRSMKLLLQRYGKPQI